MVIPCLRLPSCLGGVGLGESYLASLTLGPSGLRAKAEKPLFSRKMAELGRARGAGQKNYTVVGLASLIYDFLQGLKFVRP